MDYIKEKILFENAVENEMKLKVNENRLRERNKKWKIKNHNPNIRIWSYDNYTMKIKTMLLHIQMSNNLIESRYTYIQFVRLEKDLKIKFKHFDHKGQNALTAAKTKIKPKNSIYS